MPVLREGSRPALIARTGLPTPLHLARTLAPLLAALACASGSRPRAPRARSASSTPTTRALDEQTFADWLRAHGQSENAIAALWNLIALPTLNLPADQASLSAAVKVFRTGLLDSAAACDIGVPAVPFRRLHAEPAAAALEPRGRRRSGSARRVRAVTAERRLAARRREHRRGRRGHPRRPARGARRRSPRPRRSTATRSPGSARARSSTCTSTTTGACSTSRSPRRSTRRCSGSSTGPRPPGRARASWSPSRSRTPSARSAPRSRSCASATCPRSNGCCPRPAAPRCSTSPSPTSRARPSGPLPARAGCGPGRGRPCPASTSPAPGRTPAGRRRWRAPSAAASPRRRRRSPRSEGRGMSVTADRALDAAHAALTTRARGHLLSLQQPGGCWKGELETNVTIDAEDLFLRHFLGLARPSASRADRARWIRSRQRPDGSWATYYGGPGDLSTTVEAYVALRLAGDPRRRRAHGAGGRVHPRRRRRRGDAGVHAHVAVAARPLVVGRRADAAARADPAAAAGAALGLLVRLLGAPDDRRALGRDRARARRAPSGSRIDELRDRRPAAPPRPTTSGGGRSSLFDRAAHIYGRHPVGRLRRRALRTAERWIVERQERDGSWGGIQPPWVWSIIALHALGYPLDHPVLERGARRPRHLHDRRRRGPPDRGLPVAGLGHRPRGDRAARRGRRARQRRDRARVRVARRPRRSARAGDWAVRRPGLAPGGFPFEFANEQLPRRRRHGGRRARPPPRRPRLPRGGRARARLDARDAEPLRRLGAPSTSTTRAASPRSSPFCDFGAVTDPPSADVTAHVLETLAYEGLAGEPAARARARLAAAPAGAGRLLVRPLGRELPLRHRRRAAGARRLRPRRPRERRGGGRVARGVQNPGGGFGEDLRSYRDRSWSGRGASTASQTAWALLGAARGGSRRGRGRGARRRAGSSRPSARTAAGTSRSTPAPASRATSTSTTTSTATSSR